jgi:plastocyanin
MLPRRELLAAILMSVTATWASAASDAKEHTVIILQSSYFPAEVALKPGDFVRFVNSSGHEHAVTGEHNTWTTGSLPADSEVVFEFDASMLGVFFGDDAGTFRGVFSLKAP